MKRFIFSVLIISCVLILVSCSDFEGATDEENIIKQESVEGELTVHYIDAGQADATLFEWKEDDRQYTMLYDTGDWNKTDVIDYLHEREVDEIDVIIISHPHADHIGQLKNILETFTVHEVWMPGTESNSQTFEDAITAILDNDDINYEEPRAGDNYNIGHLAIEIIHPETIINKPNEDSISFIATFNEIKFAFTGDAGVNEEQQMIERMENIQANFLHLGHHGSNTSTSLEFLRAVNPDYAIYSAGESNSYNHPHEEVIQRLTDENIPYFGTDINGTITIQTDGEDYEIFSKADDAENDSSHQETNNNAAKNCIDINNASTEELEKIIHVGPGRAEHIIKNRPYEDLAELNVINGLSDARVSEIIDEGIACLQ
ncbi:MAG TPA: MBL fold metallo-hydrolase [Bacillota bacterium]|nr:MBL fold metallo-hydrolase [Bacillota bacterium]